MFVIYPKLILLNMNQPWGLHIRESYDASSLSLTLFNCHLDNGSQWELC